MDNHYSAIINSTYSAEHHSTTNNSRIVMQHQMMTYVTFMHGAVFMLLDVTVAVIIVGFHIFLPRFEQFAVKTLYILSLPRGNDKIYNVLTANCSNLGRNI